MPDLFIVATDANCRGYTERKREIDLAIEKFKEITIYAIPDPHIERWLLLDSLAGKCQDIGYPSLILKSVTTSVTRSADL